MRRSCKDKGAASVGNLGTEHGDMATRGGILLGDDSVGWLKYFVAVGGANVGTKFDLCSAGAEGIGYGGVEGLVEGDAKLGRACRVDCDGLGGLRVCVGDFEDFSWALGAGAPVWGAAVAAYIEAALG